MRKKHLTLFLFALIIAVGAAGVALNLQPKTETAGIPVRSHSAADNTDTELTGLTPYTIMVYMNGSDLESEYGAATDDLTEILDSGLDSRNANVLIFTGGTLRWQNDAIPETECVIWRYDDGYLNEVKSVGKVNMGNPDTLRDFITFSISKFPAQNYGLIMWDHGGGSIAGFGHDEKFNEDSLTLLDMKKAFDEAGLAENQLEFLGFDACLMATVEMSVLANDYAKVLIASEDLEPGEGWNYYFLDELNKNPYMDGFEIGEIIVDTFMDYYEAYNLADEEILTISVIDLSKASYVMDTMGLLMSRSSAGFNSPEISRSAFGNVALRRANTKTFGEGSPRDNYSDMVDIGDMAVQLSDEFPDEAEAVLTALESCVVYNRHNSDTAIYGLSTYYIYGGKDEGIPSLRTYSALEMNGAYTQFLHRFFDGLIRTENSECIRSELVLWQPIENEQYRLRGLSEYPEYNDFLWPTVNGEFVCLFPVTDTSNAERYAIPAEVNNQNADIIVIFNSDYPDGKIMGIRHNADYVFQKGCDPINASDEISFYYLTYDFSSDTEEWIKSEPFSGYDSLDLLWEEAPASFKQGFRHTDTCNCITFTAPY